jgi:FAD/FMN-containing dehydrogenase
VPAGSASWLDVGRALSCADVVINTSRMARLIEHEPADLVATVEAGLTLDSLNATLRCAHQWLPLDPPDDDARATLGGIAATGLSGAQAYGYGAPRSFVLGMRVALAGGRIVKAGGRVVKNVAGYDLCKLFTGSYGTLGLIVELTFKLRPLPAREATTLVRAIEYRALLTAARSLPHTNFLPVALELLSPRMASTLGLNGDAQSHALLVRFAGTEESVAAQTKLAREYFTRAAGVNSVETLEDDAQLWRAFAAQPLSYKARLIWRARTLPTQLCALLDEFGRGKVDSIHDALWHVSVGDGRLRVMDARETCAGVQVSELERLRGYVRAHGGSLVLENAAPEIKRAFDAWGFGDASMRLMRRVKNELDPQAIFSPGRMLKQ